MPETELAKTISEREITIDEFKQFLMADRGLTSAEADAHIRPHTLKKILPDKVYAVSKVKREAIANGFYLQCMATIYVWRDTTSGENLEIIHVAAPYVGLYGQTNDSNFSGSQEASNTATKATVDYNGHFLFTASRRVYVGFGTVRTSTTTTIIYRHPASGQFTWLLAEI